MTTRAKTEQFELFSRPQAHLFWQAALWQMLSCACFAAINGIVRYLGGGGSLAPDLPLPGNVVPFFQNVFGALFLVPFLLKKPQGSFLPKNDLHIHFLRVLFGALGVCLWYFALQKMPIAMGLALTFTSPIFTVLGAKVLLHEAITGRRALAITLSILGAFIISRPDRAFTNQASSLGWAALLPLGAAVAYALCKLLTRRLAAKGESAESLATTLLMLMAPISLLMALPEWRTPQLTHFPWLIALGLLAAVAHLSFGKAYEKAEVALLMPFGFSKFLFSTLIGYLFFLEVPSPTLLVGLLFIASSILLLSKKNLIETKKRAG